MTPGEAERVLGVDRGTLSRWTKTGRIRYVRTLGGHRRLVTADVLAVLARLAAARQQPV